MKSLITIAVAILLAACDPETKDITGNFVIPEEFSDCVFKRMGNTYGNYITVVRCPNSTVSTIQSDKSHTTTIVIDGIKYVPTK